MPGAPGPGRRVLDFADHVGGTVKLHVMGLVRGHKKLSTVPAVTWIEHHDSLLGGALCGPLALEMLLQQMPNETAGRGAVFAQRVELGFQRLGELN